MDAKRSMKATGILLAAAVVGFLTGMTGCLTNQQDQQRGPIAAAVPPPATTSALAPATTRRTIQRDFVARPGNVLDIANNAVLTSLTTTRVTLDLKNAPLAEALKEFQTAASLPHPITTTKMNPTQIPPVNLHLNNAPLVEAVLQLASATGCAIDTFNVDDLQFHVLGRSRTAPMRSVAGPFAVSLRWSEVNSRARPEDFPTFARPMASTAPRPTSTSVAFDYLVDPRIPLAQYPDAVVIEEFRDEQGAELPLLNTTGYHQNLDHTGDVQQRIFYEPGRKITVLRGSMRFGIMKEGVPLQIDLTKREPFRKDLGSLAIEVSPLESPMPYHYTFTVRLQRGTMPLEKFKETSLSIRNSRPVITAKEETVLVFMTSDRASEDPDVATCRCLFPTRRETSQPLTMTFDVPLEILPVQVPFEFRSFVMPD